MDLLEFLIQKDSEGRLVSSSDDYNRILDHIYELLVAAESLLDRNIHGVSLFCSITSLEEISKLHFGIYSDGKAKFSKRRMPWSKDHFAKQQLSVSRVLHLCDRLRDALSSQDFRDIAESARRGEWNDMRERALYFSQEGAGISTPQDKIPPDVARNLLLFALEMFDDHLVGYTEYSMQFSDRIDSVFNRVKSR